MTNGSNQLGSADLQVHTDQSDGMDDAITMLNAAQRQGLDLVAITDHDHVRGALLAQDRATQLNHPVDVIVGSEVTSRHGHILALWIDSPIPPFRSAAATVEAIWKQDGVAIIAHPAAVVPFALSPTNIDRLLLDLAAERRGKNAPVLAIETANPIPSARWRRLGIINDNRRWALPQTGGSDAHFHEQVGAGATRFPGSTQQDLRDALESSATSAELGHYPSFREIGASRLLRQQWRGISATPKALIRRRLGQDR